MRQPEGDRPTNGTDPDLRGQHYRARALLTVFALACFGVLVSGVLAYRAATSFAESSRLVQRAYVVLDSIQGIELVYSRTASAARTYVLSGNPVFLGFYRTEVAQVQPAIDRALQSMSEAPAQRRQLSALTGEMNDRIRMIEDAIRLFESGGLGAVANRELPGNDGTLEQRVLAIIEKAKQDHEAILAARLAQDDARLASLRITLAAFLAASIAILALLLWRTRSLESRREQIAREFRRQRLLLETIVENAPLGIYFKRSGVAAMDLVNRFIERLTGQPRAVLVGNAGGEANQSAFTAGILAAERRMDISAGGQAGQQFEVDLPAGRRTLQVREVRVPGATDNDPHLLGIVEDITDQLAAETALKQTTRQLEHKSRELELANKELESFAYSVSHDLRAPLRAVGGFAAILGEEYRDRLDEPGLNLLGRIQWGADRMGQLIHDLLSFSRLSRQPVLPSRVETAQLVCSAWEAQRGAHPESPAELQIAGTLPACWGDQRLLLQVWKNLIENAVKYSSRATHPLVTVQGEELAEEVVFHIEDNGVGFDMRHAERLFEVFQRLHGEADFPGTGVGLAIVHRIIARHGGRIWARSEPGKGARFSFALPRQAPTQHA